MHYSSLWGCTLVTLRHFFKEQKRAIARNENHSLVPTRLHALRVYVYIDERRHALKEHWHID